MLRHLVLFSGSRYPVVVVQLSELRPSLLGSCLYDSSTSLGGGNYSCTEAVTKLWWIPPCSLHQEVEFKFLDKPSNGHRPPKRSHCPLGSPQRVNMIRLFLGLLVPVVVWVLD